MHPHDTRARIVIDLEYDPTNPDQRLHEDQWLKIYDWLVAGLPEHFGLHVKAIHLDGIA